MEIKGKVVNVLPLEKGTSKAGREWQKATIVVEYGEGQYFKTVAVSNMKNAEAFSNIAVGTEVTLQVDVTSREVNGRWYSSCDCWRWETGQQAAPAPAYPANDPYAAMMPPKQQVQTKQSPQPQEDDGLPF